MIRHASHIGRPRLVPASIPALGPALGPILGLALALGACTDVRSSQPASDTEREAARGLVRQLSALSVQPESAAQILVATDGLPLLALLAPEGMPLPIPTTDPAAHDRAAAVGREHCLIAGAASVTFRQCAIGSHAIEGTWSAERERIHAELVDVFVIDPDLHALVAVEANLSSAAQSSAELSGALELHAMWSTAEDDLHVLDANLRIDNLLLDAPDCASGGSITITGAWSNGPPSTTSLWFGPGCSDVQIAR